MVRKIEMSEDEMVNCTFCGKNMSWEEAELGFGMVARLDCRDKIIMFFRKMVR